MKRKIRLYHYPDFIVGDKTMSDSNSIAINREIAGLKSDEYPTGLLCVHYDFSENGIKNLQKYPPNTSINLMNVELSTEFEEIWMYFDAPVGDKASGMLEVHNQDGTPLGFQYGVVPDIPDVVPDITQNDQYYGKGLLMGKLNGSCVEHVQLGNQSKIKLFPGRPGCSYEQNDKGEIEIKEKIKEKEPISKFSFQ